MLKNKHVYHVTHGVDIDGLTCSAILSTLPMQSYTRTYIKVYDKLVNELPVIESKLQEGHIVIISDLCFYDSRVSTRIKKLLVEYPQELIILDHHAETLHVLENLKQVQDIGYSELSLTHAHKNHSAAYITLKFFEQFQSPTEELRDFVHKVSDWDTFSLKDASLDVLRLQYYFLTYGNKKFHQLVNNSNWQKVLADEEKTQAFDKITQTISYIKKHMHKENTPLGLVMQFPDNFRSTDARLSIENISEIIAYTHCKCGGNVIAIVGNKLVLYRGKESTLKNLLSIYHVPTNLDVNYICIFAVNLHKNIVMKALE